MISRRGRFRPQITCRLVRIYGRVGAVGVQRVVVAGYFRDRQYVRLLASLLPLWIACVHVQTGSPAQIGKAKTGTSISAVDGTQQRVERLVLVDRQDLAVTLGPAAWGKVEAENFDFRQKGFRHWVCS